MNGVAKDVKDMGGAKKHFLLLPYPAFGHITPLLELSRKIAATGHQASLAVSESLLKDMRTRKMMTPQEETLINFVGLNDGIRHVFDEHFSTDVMCDVTDRCCAFLDGFISNLPLSSKNDGSNHEMPPVDVILADIIFGAVPFEAAVRSGITCFGFSPVAGYIAAQMFRVQEDTPTSSEDYDIIKEADPNMIAVAAAWKDGLVRFNKVLLQTDGVLIHSFEALEPTFCETVVQTRPDFKDLKIRFIGPILPNGSIYDDQHYRETKQILKWLDAQPERSVVYFSFGTVAVANVAQIKEITDTLVGLKRPFIWSLRPAQQKFLPAEVQEASKPEFDSPNKPYLIVPWAPQKAVLKHKAVRVFVSHCGWNSTLEGISCGVPIVAWPMLGDQHGNAELVSAIGCGKKLAMVNMMGERIVGREELTDIIDQVAQWNTPLMENSFFMTAQNLGQAAMAAISEGGNSAETFKYLLDVSPKKQAM
ncbi:hypothetical protein RvY_04709 [Ramazzottius varieornatus]|uniref:UDP-glucuronosyltransferase n=1 Tax=Ramazzottius varieornatus TaxID=947166 RepID=A0A1D1UVV6_RAMVA|nr:hypothetical protein RvY_04709 [Ramazzottius varieornatus]